MALFKISKGSSANLPDTLTEGYCWYTYDDSLFYIDYKDTSGNLIRKALNAKDAETIMGKSIGTALNDSEVEIPTSKLVKAYVDSARAALESSKMPYAPSSIEMNQSGLLKSYGGFIDFHFYNSDGKPTNASGTVVSITPDYTSRIIEDSAGTISINGVKMKGSSITNGTFLGTIDDNVTLITTADIDTICNASIQNASEVMF